jgi:UDP-N-acetylglucosamine--N-acetylmuramyl-(pentapeptide) pyrophosphoryl-undecaprenol N-acetylglucosamine transferase
MLVKKNILLAAGGTGGHFFPAIALAEELASNKHNVYLFTDRRCEKYITQDMPVIPHIVNLHINMSGLFYKIKSIYQLALACINAIFLLIKLKPAIVIGFGGYPSFPAMFAAWFLRVPLIIQEQNCFLGKSNRIFSNNAKYIALSYKETSNIKQKHKSKVIYTGDIIRESIRKLPPKKSFNSDIFKIFVVGGSQGAKFFSEFIPDTVKKLKALAPEVKIHITQQTAKEYMPKISEIYDSLKIEYVLQEFFHDIHNIYKETDIVIARSGASTIAELTSIGLPAIFIPFPYSMENHQMFNAMALVNDNASWCYDQKNITNEVLAQKLLTLIKDRNLLLEASKNLIKRKTNGAEYFANTVIEIINR